MIGGFKIIQCAVVGEAYEDWSDVRSPSRALRRRRQGHRQNVKIRYRANGEVLVDKARGVAYAHPDDFPMLMRKLEEAL